MKVYRDINEIPFNINRVITVGTFDGVHIGHLEIIRTIKNDAKNYGLKTMIITFEPHPQIYFTQNAGSSFVLLTTIEERLDIFRTLNIDEVFVVKFDDVFANITAREFVVNYLLQKIGFKLIVIGYNHNFGKNREGNLASLEKLQTECTVNNRTIFAVKQVPKFSLTNNNVSSSTIRKMFEHDDIEQINKLLGYHYFIAGNVQAGNGIGATIGFPTANLNTFSTYKAIPKHGVYFCSVQVFNKQYWGITNIGFAPTFENNNATTSKNKLKLEVHIFDFFGDIYDVNIIVSFIKYLRKEKKFNNKDELIKQIQNDVVVCKQLIAQQKTTIKN